METLAANVIGEGFRAYRKRSASGTPKKRGYRKFRGAINTFPKLWKFRRMVSTGQSGTALAVKTNAAGTIVFANGLTESQNLSMDFALDAFRIYLGGVNVSTTAVPGYNELTALFDKFRIDKIEIFYTCSQTNQTTIGPNQQFLMPGCAYVVDTDDANSTSCAELQQYANCRYTQFGGITTTGMKRLAVFTPKCQVPIYASGTTITGQGQSNVWLDAATPEIHHYGFKMAMDNLVASPSVGQVWYGLNFQVRYHLSMKDLR